MSLPTKMRFMKNGESVAQIEANIGWSFDVDDLPDFIIKSINEWNPFLQRLIDEGKPQLISKLIKWGEIDFDEIQVYGYSVSYEDFKKWHNDEITHEEIVDRFQKLESYYGKRN